MLKPFRIRELLDASEDAAARKVGECEISRHGLDGVVRVTSSQYDETITSNPEARLSYVDEDDGESIMVGSSLELSQRLEEPFPEWLLSARHRQGAALSRESDLAPMHIFDIRRSPDVLRTWRDIHSRSEMISTSSNAMRASLGSNDTEHVSNTGVTSPDSPFGPIDVQSNNLTDARRRWVQHCDPPQVQTSAPAFQVESDSKKVRTATVDAVREHNVVEVESEFKIGCITEEGRRQAKAAGAKLRDSRNLFTDNRPSPSGLPSPTFWNTYSHGEKAFNSEPDRISIREPKINESPVEDSSLFNAFEAELAKLMSESATESEQQPVGETSQGNCTQQVEPDAAPGQDGSRPGATGPGEIAALTMHTLLSGIAHVTSDLRTRLPEVERRLATLQRNVPPRVESRVNTALEGMKSHVQTLANVMQETARSTRATAERSRDSEALASAQVDALRNLARDLGEMGKTLFAAFETRVAAGRGAQESQPEEATSTVTTDSAKNEDEASDKVKVDEDGPVGTESGLSGDAKSPATETTLWILSVSPDATEDIIRNALASQGFIGNVTLHKLLDNGRKTSPRSGYGEIKFPSLYAALGAFQALKDMKICDKPITLLAPRHPVTGTSLLETPHESGIDTAAGEDRPRAPFRHRPAFRGCRIPRDTVRPKPSVNFDSPVEPDKKTADLRRAKSLSTLLAERRFFRTSEMRAPAAPHVPPKESHAHADEEGRGKESEKAPQQSSPTLMDEDSTDAEFSARYPPMSTLLNPSTHNANNQKINEVNGPHDVPRSLTDSLPGAFPSDTSPEQRDTAPEPPSYPAILNPPTSNTVGPSHLSFSRNSPPPPPTFVRRSATERHSSRRAPWEAAFEAGLGSRRRRDHRSVHMANTRGSFPVGNRPSGLNPPYPESWPQPEMVENNSNSGIDLCVGHLQALGFADGDMARLRIYAEAANGNLGDAIEMIEEERRVLEQHN